LETVLSSKLHNLCIFSLDIQGPEQFANTLEVPFTPSMFLSSKDEYDIIDPLYKPLN